MPPKVLRRPAGAKAAPKGKAKPKPKPKARGRGRGLGVPPGRLVRHRRRADRGRDRPEELLVKDLEKGRWLEMRMVEIQGVYWKEQVKVAGMPTGLIAEEGEAFVSLHASGTTSEALLKWLSGQEVKKVKVHLCKADCGQEICEDGLVHGVKVREIKADDEEEWMRNLEAVPRERGMERIREEALLMSNESDSSQDSSKKGRKRRKKKKEKREKKAKEKKEKEKKVPKEKVKKSKDLGEAEEPRKKEKRPRSEDSKDSGIVSRERTLEVAFKGSGLDPNPTRRKKVMRKARRLAKASKKKVSKDSSASSSESTSPSSRSSLEGGLYPEEVVAKRLWVKYPGCLTSGSVREMQTNLLTSQGQVWEVDRGVVPALALQYFRTQLSSRMQPAMKREALHLAFSLDLGLQGRFPEMMDVLTQRLKALESQAMGNHYTVTSKMELVPQEQGTVATALETERAARLAREDWKIRSAASRPHATTSGGGWEQKGGKGKESKGKGKAKEGKKSDGGQGAWQKSTWHQEVSKEEEKKDPKKK